MTTDEAFDELRLLHKLTEVTNEYDVMHRRAVRDLALIRDELAVTRGELAEARSVLRAVAHDLRAQLSAIQGSTDLLLERPDLIASQRRLIERVESAARAITMLNDELENPMTEGT